MHIAVEEQKMQLVIQLLGSGNTWNSLTAGLELSRAFSLILQSLEVEAHFGDGPAMALQLFRGAAGLESAKVLSNSK